MKNTHMLFYSLCITIVLHGAQQQPLDNKLSIACVKSVQKELEKDYSAYIVNRLKEYKKTAFSIDDMNTMMQTSILFTGKPRVDFQYEKDEEQNTFTHLAIQKKDLKILNWLTQDRRYLAHSLNSSGKEPIDLCLEHLMPTTPLSNQEIEHLILEMVTTAYQTRYAFDLKKRKLFLHKMLAIQLEHKKRNSPFVLKEEILEMFLPAQLEITNDADIILADVYREVMDNDKNNFTHIAVQNNAPDDLYDLIQKNYVSLTKNAQEKTPLDLAGESFRQFTQNYTLIEPNKDAFTKHRCCLFMLLNYIRIQNDKKIYIVQCCDKHTL